MGDAFKQQPVGLSTSDSIPPETIQSYASDFEVSREEAARRLEIQSRGVDLFDPLERALAERFAGLWFSNDDGVFVIPVIHSDDDAIVAAQLEERGISADDFRTVPARWSWDQLRSSQEALDRQLFDLFSEHLVATAPDVKNNSVVVAVSEAIPPEAETRVRDAASRQEVSVEIRPVAPQRLSPPTQACVFPDCDKPLRGGVEMYRSDFLPCSTGFLVYGNVNGQRYMMTAGHCLQDTTSWWAQEANQTQQGIGGVWNWMYGWRGDAGIVRVVPDSPWNMPAGQWTPGVVYWNAQNFHSILNAASSYKGLYVCHSGRSTGSSCGAVEQRELTIAFDRQPPYPDTPVGGIAQVGGASLCTLGGDSGGPVFTNNVAVGIWNAGFSGCDIDGYFTEINNAAPEMGTYLAIGPYS